MTGEPVDVLVVGAGPTGLALAAELAAFGVRARLIDRGLDRVHEARALAIQPRTLEVLAVLGVTDELIAGGNRAVQLRMHVPGRVLAVPMFDLGLDDTAYPFLLFLSQAETERVLGEHLTAAGVPVERGVELAGLSDAGDAVTATLRGLELMGQWLGASRLTVAATSVGRARRALETATEWAAHRRQFGQPIGRFQGIGFRLADMATELEAAELLTLRAAARLDAGTMTDADAAMAKLYASEALGRITDAAVQVFGGMGLMSELPVERWWRDARVERIWDGTSEIQRHIIARALLRPHGA